MPKSRRCRRVVSATFESLDLIVPQSICCCKRDYHTSMDKEWEAIQQKTFTKWVNNQLASKGKLSKSENQILTCQETLTDAPIGKYNASPKFRLQKIENLNRALKFIRERGVSLTNIGAEDIVDGNHKLTLGMVWTIVLRFTIDEISDIRSNTALAFKVAEEALGIPQLLDVADLCDISKPDELSVMTYVAQYFHAFSELDRDRTAGRRVVKFVELVQSVFEATNDYEQRVQQLLLEIGEIQESWKLATFDGTYKGAKSKALEFTQYKATTKRKWLAEKHDLDTLLGNIQIKLNTYKLRPYVPPEEMTLSAVDTKWNLLIKAEAQRREGINRSIREVKQKLRECFASLANGFGQQLSEISSLLSKIQGVRLKEIASLDQQCQAANIEENDSVYSYEDLQYDLDLTRRALNKKKAFIENQIISRNTTNLTPKQLEEFESSFRHFDTDDSNTLSLIEFQACLAALGFLFPDEEVEELFSHVSKGSGTISFEQYLDFMISSAEDKTSPDQLIEAFAVVAGGKVSEFTVANLQPYVTELDLKRQDLPPAVIEYLVQTMPQASDLTEEEIAAAEQSQEGLVLDFNAYLDTVFYSD
ncbi:alpha-actinin [Massospora cicadina]|nr:alpha-actinin [Massospora cicadina]